MAKPMKKSRRFAEGDLVTGTTNVRTRSDDVIGDTNPRTGVYTPGSYDRNRAAGESNLNAVKGLWNRITGGSSDDSGTGTRGIKASVSDTKYEPTKSSVADYIGKSTEPKSAESKSSGFNSSSVKGTSAFGDYSGTSKSDDSGSKSSAPETKPSSKLPITVEGDYPKKSDTSTDTDEKPAAKKEDKKPAAKATAKTTDSSSKNYGAAVGSQPTKKSTDTTDSSSKNYGAAVGSQPTKKSTDTTDSSSKNYGSAVGSQPTKKAAEEKKPETKAAAKTDYYRGADGKMHPKTPEPAPKSEDEWGTQNIKRNLQNAPGDVMKGLKKVGSALSNFETIAERRSREAKEAKNKPVAKRSGGAVKKMASGGSVKSSASSRGDGIASRGKTRGKIY